jgi:hypothetical protein
MEAQSPISDHRFDENRTAGAADPLRRRPTGGVDSVTVSMQRRCLPVVRGRRWASALRAAFGRSAAGRRASTTGHGKSTVTRTGPGVGARAQTMGRIAAAGRHATASRRDRERDHQGTRHGEAVTPRSRRPATTATRSTLAYPPQATMRAAARPGQRRSAGRTTPQAGRSGARRCGPRSGSTAPGASVPRRLWCAPRDPGWCRRTASARTSVPMSRSPVPRPPVERQGTGVARSAGSACCA